MKITWIGHSCFRIEQNGYSVVTDPYEDGSVPGLQPLREKANMVLCSHEHGDHNARSLVKIKPAKECPFTITRIETWHDNAKGRLRGPNIIHILEADGVKIAHLGDLGCRPDPEQMELLKGLNVCLIPVGGFFTIDGKQAAELIREIRPGVTIPMHFKDKKKGFGFPVIGTVEAFAKHMDSVERLGKSVIETEEMDNLQGKVIILEPENLTGNE